LSSTQGASFSPALPNRQTITSNTAATSSVITSVAHGLTTNDFIYIYNSNSTPSIDGVHQVTVLTGDTFSIPVTVSIAGTTGYFSMNDDAVVSDNNTRPNVLAISKFSQPESVPLISSLPVGSANFPIKRILTNRDSLFVFKDDGIFIVNGEDRSNFRVQLLDNTAILLGPETAVTLNNQIFCFTTQGVCSVSETGVQILSKPIEGEILSLANQENGFGDNFFQQRAFGVAVESRRSYILYLPSFGVDNQSTQQFVYNFFTGCWYRWTTKRSCGVASRITNVLYTGNSDNSFIYKEREDNGIISNPLNVYADESYNVEISDVTDNVITVDAITNLSEGYTVRQGNLEAVILGIDSDTNQLTLSNDTAFSLSTAQVSKPINPIVEFIPIDIENPGILKQYREYTLIFKNRAVYNVIAQCRSNFYIQNNSAPTFTTNALTIDAGLPFISYPWREAPFDKTNPSSWEQDAAIRTFVPLEVQRALWIAIRISTNQAFTYFQLQGVSVVFNAMETRFK